MVMALGQSQSDVINLFVGTHYAKQEIVNLEGKPQSILGKNSKQAFLK